MNIPAVIISEHPSTIELLKLYINEFNGFNFLAGTSNISKAYDAVKELEGNVLVIVDVSDYQEQGLNLVSKITYEYRNSRVVVLSDKPDIDLVIRDRKSVV